MRAAVIRGHGPPDSIFFENRSLPDFESNQVRVQVKAVGLNHLDTWVRRGVPGHKFPLPLVPGSDISGVVDGVGKDVKNIKHGDRVLVNPSIYCGTCKFCTQGNDNLCSKWGLLGETADGGCQEYITLDSTRVFKLSDTLSFEEAACIPINFVTSWQMLVVKAQIQKDEWVLIHGAGSGVSLACVQIAKRFGAKVALTSSSDEKLQKAKSLGVEVTINTASKDFSLREALKKTIGQSTVDVVVDHVGAPTFMQSIQSLRKGGRLVSCGATAGSLIEIDWKYVFFKNITLFGSTYGTVQDFKDVLSEFENKKLKAIIDSKIKLEELPKAHQQIESRGVFGKVIVEI